MKTWAKKMSRRWRKDQQRACSLKVRYPSREAAWQATAALRKGGRADRTTMPYECAIGDHWHVGQWRGAMRQQAFRLIARGAAS